MNAPIQPTTEQIRQAALNMNKPGNRDQKIYRLLQHVKRIKKPPHSAK